RALTRADRGQRHAGSGSSTVVRNHCGMNSNTELLGAVVLARGTVDPPAHGTPVRDVAYPIAFDAGELLGAVAFATWDPYPGDFEPEWWCTVELFLRYPDGWHSCGGEHDNTTSATPFERPVEGDWIEWHSNGGGSG